MELIEYGKEVYLFTVLPSKADPDISRVNPTIVAGDVKISRDGLPFVNLTNLPTVNPAGSKLVQIQLTLAETSGKIMVVQFVDQDYSAAGGQWREQNIILKTINYPYAGVPFLYVDVQNWLGNSAPSMSGDSFACLGTPQTGTIAGDLLSVRSGTTTIVNKLPVGNIADNASVLAVGANTQTVLADTTLIKGYTDTLEAGVANIASKLPAGGGNVAAENGLISIASNLDSVRDFTSATYNQLPPAGQIIASETGIIASIASNMDTIQSNVNDMHLKLPAGDIADQNTSTTIIDNLQTVDNNIESIINLLPATISTLNLDTSMVDGVTLRKVFELMLTMVDGNFTVDPTAGTVTFFRRNNTTAITVVRPTTEGRTRVEVL